MCSLHQVGAGTICTHMHEQPWYLYSLHRSCSCRGCTPLSVPYVPGLSAHKTAHCLCTCMCTCRFHLTPAVMDSHVYKYTHAHACLNTMAYVKSIVLLTSHKDQDHHHAQMPALRCFPCAHVSIACSVLYLCSLTGEACKADEPGFFRICWAWCPADALPHAARRMGKLLRDRQAQKGDGPRKRPKASEGH